MSRGGDFWGVFQRQRDGGLGYARERGDFAVTGQFIQGRGGI